MIPPALRILLCAQPVDMRRSFDGLAALVVEKLDEDPTADGALFVFVNRDRDKAKLLWRDATGFCLLYKRLDARVFALPDVAPTATHVNLDARALSALLDGAAEDSTQRTTARDIARAAKLAVKEHLAKESPQPLR
jgi:transposase